MKMEQEAGDQKTRRLWLVRHGITVWNSQQRYCGHSAIPLSERGRVQARNLAQRLRPEGISTIYSSDLLRAQQTAEIIVQKQTRPIPIELSAAWRELDFGVWEGLTYEQIRQQFASSLDFFSDPLHNAPPHGESFSSLIARVQTALVLIARRAFASQDTGDILLVSHGGPLRVLLCSVLGIPLERQWQLRIDHGSLSALDLLPGPATELPIVTLTLFNMQVSG